jgi:hypothetical protein
MKIMPGTLFREQDLTPGRVEGEIRDAIPPGLMDESV